MSEYIYEWEFDDSKDRGTLWYVIALSIVIGLSIWGFFTKQYGMSFIVLLIAGLVYFVDNNSEDYINVKISDSGIIISETNYNFQNIESYSIVYKGDKAVLLRIFLIKKGIKNIDVKIDDSKIDDSKIDNIKNVLNNYIKEASKIELSFTEKVIQMLKL
ncbi:MAG: hypothetical protein Q8K30_03735 [Candidatus Gracilibacteria bacterium]|nr:hypothetical protein [Candidatus Gracilibacteria bacterium]